MMLRKMSLAALAAGTAKIYIRACIVNELIRDCVWFVIHKTISLGRRLIVPTGPLKNEVRKVIPVLREI